jgi:hypothetical protein
MSPHYCLFRKVWGFAHLRRHVGIIVRPGTQTSPTGHFLPYKPPLSPILCRSPKLSLPHADYSPLNIGPIWHEPPPAPSIAPRPPPICRPLPTREAKHLPAASPPSTTLPIHLDLRRGCCHAFASFPFRGCRDFTPNSVQLNLFCSVQSND